MSSALALFLVLLGGMAAAIQPSVNAALAAHVRAIPAAFLSFFLGTLVLFGLTLWTLRGRSFMTFGQELAGAPTWAFLGGLLGVVMVCAMILGTPILGASATVTLFIASQLTVALLIDTFGLAGRPALSIQWPQVLGILLVIGGVRLVLWR